MIKIFTTGGTIDKVYYDALSEYSVGTPQILSILQGAKFQPEFDMEILLQKDSLELTDDDRRLITQRVEEEENRQILITHGTDTMADTAQALTDIKNKVIVLVGSLSPARFKGSDAEFNIGFALGALQCLPEGVYVAMNGRVFPAEDVRKNREKNRFELTSGDD